MTNYIPLVQVLHELPVSKGDTLWITADLSRLGLVVKIKEGHFSLDDLIDQLQQMVGDEGTVVVPAFNHTLRNRDLYNIKETRPLTGTLATALMSRRDFVRTANPLHSFLVWGKWKDELVSLNNDSSFGKGSPFEFLLDHDCKTLLIGTSVEKAFTFAHYVEEQCNVKYRKIKRYTISYQDFNGKTTQRNYSLFAKKAGWDMCLGRLEKLFEEKGVLFKITRNGIPFSMLNLRDTYDIIYSDISDNKARNIASFSSGLYLRQLLKRGLKYFFNYKTLGERASR